MSNVFGLVVIHFTLNTRGRKCALSLFYRHKTIVYTVLRISAVYIFKTVFLSNKPYDQSLLSEHEEHFSSQIGLHFSTESDIKKKQRYEFVFFYSTKCVLEFVGKRFLVCRL